MSAIISYPPIFRAKDLPVRRAKLHADVSAGRLNHPWRGIFVLPGTPLTGQRMAAFALRRPDAVFGLWTALDFHDLTDKHVSRVEAFIPRTTCAPRFTDIPHSVVQQKVQYLCDGTQPIEILGVFTRITSPARAVVDAFRFSKRIPIRYAIEALREYVASGGQTNQVATLARTFRVYRLMQPYLRVIR